MFQVLMTASDLNVLMGFNGPFWSLWCWVLLFDLHSVCYIYILLNGITFFTFIQKVTILPNYIPFALKQSKWSKKLNCKRPKMSLMQH